GGNFNGLGGGAGGGPGGGLFGGGGFGGPGGFGGGGFGGGRGNFRGFNPGQPHGAIFWIGSNSALNAEPFSLRGQTQQQPANGTNRFGITFMSAPYLPGVTKPSGKDTMFLTLIGQRSSSPLDEYATVPTDGSFPGTYNERTGNFTGQSTIYDPAGNTTCGPYGATPGQPFPGNVIPFGCIVAPAQNLLLGNQAVSPALPQFFPLPNLPGYAQNYHLLTTVQTNSTQAGVRYMRSLGKNATLLGMGRGGRRAQQNLGLRQSINFNYNWIGTAADNANVFPQLGGKSSTNSNSVQAGYTAGYHKLTNIFNANWNRATSQAKNYFTNTTDIATTIGVLGPPSGLLPAPALNTSPINFGLPDVTLSNFTGLSEQQPSLVLSQTISLSETLSWIHGQNNIRIGGDYRRVHHDFLGGTNSTGTFYFTGLYTGSSLGDFLLGDPEETSIDSSASKSYLRENVWDAYATDDWRARPNLTLNYGLRYEFFAPYTEKYGHLAMVDTNPTTNASYPALFSVTDEVQAGGSGSYNGPLPDSLVFPFRVAVAPRLGMALRLPKQIVVRAGYGINYTVSQYATFATTMAHQPMVNDPSFVNEQTNESNQCPSTTADCLSLANGFPTPDTVGNYALDPHYRLPYVQVWNLDVQKTMPWGVVVNVGYNGSMGSNLDITSAPRASASSPLTNPTAQLFNYDQSVAFSRFNAGTLRLNRRLSKSIAFGANYQYSHSIDNAGSVGGTSTVVAQNWQDLGAEEGNSSFDVRHQVTGTYLYEFPFGEGRRWVNSGVGSHILEGFSVSGSFTFATGQPLSPTYQATVSDVENGTAGTQRPNHVPGVSVTAGAGSQEEWFNSAAFALPPNDSTTPNCPDCGNVSRNSIAGPGKILNNMSLSKTMQLGGTRSMEIRATSSNVFNTVQYSGVDTNAASPSFGQVTQAAAMRTFQFTARFRF
ncbi:MAG: carboxypeptidase regulatory-like domain-containing protein, partial [Terracidiphilus sp.]